MRLYPNLFERFAEKIRDLKTLCVLEMSQTSVTTREALVTFIVHAFRSGMEPTVLKLYNLNIDARCALEIFETILDRDVISIEDMNFGRNQLWWTEGCTE